MPNSTQSLTVLPGRFTVCRLHRRAAVPDWALGGDFFSITRTTDELSIVCREADVPEEVPCERGWACLKVEGPLDFSLTGVLASLTQPLAEAGLSLFAISTYDTDYLLVKARDLEKAVAVLVEAEHTIRSE